MKAALFYSHNDIRVEEVPTPEPGPGEVLVRIATAGICGSDLHRYRLGGMAGQTYPHMTGHEFAGEVAALGPGVTGLSVGQRVGVEPQHLVGCGQCRWCRRGDYHNCPERGRRNGRRLSSHGFAQYDVAVADYVYPLPDRVSLEAAAILDVVAVALHGVHRVHPEPWETIAVIGSGPIALCLGMIARSCGPQRVILAGLDDPTLEFAREIGACDLAVNSARDDFKQAVLANSDGGADVVYEAVGGTAPTFPQALEIAAPGGRVALVGTFQTPQTFTPQIPRRKELTLYWSDSYATWRGVREYQLALDMVADGRVRADRLITHRFPLDDIAAAFKTADQKLQTAAVKTVVQPFA
jgi:threonine dehydrogenase-like Zn-dependent dehydrogenase